MNAMRPFFPEVDEELFYRRRDRFLSVNRANAVAHKDKEITGAMRSGV